MKRDVVHLQTQGIYKAQILDKPAKQNCTTSMAPKMVIPNQARRDISRESVETGRAAPKLRSGEDEEIADGRRSAKTQVPQGRAMFFSNPSQFRPCPIQP